MRGAVLLATGEPGEPIATGAARVVVAPAGHRVVRSAGIEEPAVFVVARADDSEEDEIEASLLDGAAGLWLTRCVGRADLERAGARLAVAEARAGRAEGALAIVASVGSAAGVLALQGLSVGSRRLAGLALNEGALRSELGLPANAPPAPAIVQARALLVLAACAAKVPAIDAITPGRSPRAVEAAARAARQEGFAAKLAAAPDEVGPIERAFA